MSTYEELGFPVSEGQVTYNEKCASEYLQVMDITNALKDIVRTALTSGYSKTSYFVQDHIKYIKRIQTAKSPIGYVRSVARKLFPDASAYNAKIAKISESYKGKALLDKLESLYKLYYNISKSASPKREITLDEAEGILAELLNTP